MDPPADIKTAMEKQMRAERDRRSDERRGRAHVAPPARSRDEDRRRGGEEQLGEDEANLQVRRGCRDVAEVADGEREQHDSRERDEQGGESVPQRECAEQAGRRDEQVVVLRE